MPKQIEIGSLLIPRDPHGDRAMGTHTAVVLKELTRIRAADLYEVMVTFADPAKEREWGRIHEWRASSIMKMYEVLECPG